MATTSIRDEFVVVFSQVLGLRYCEIAGTNATHYLVRIRGSDKPVAVAHSEVFCLEEGWEVVGGGLVDPRGELVSD